MVPELEFSFVFPQATTNDTIKNLFKTGIFKDIDYILKSQIPIRDLYLSKDVRIRQTLTKSHLYKKTGDKAFKREEDSMEVGHRAEFILEDSIKLTIVKEREVYQLGNLPKELESAEVYIMIDTISYPMKIKMVEIECDEKTFLFLSQLNDGFMKLKRNTKSAWDYFHRKIGFVGAPSSGKTAMSRKMVNNLSINYGIPAEQVAEYARTFISRYGVPKWYLQPLIEWGQNRREQDAKNHTVIVTDSPRFLPYIYCVFNHKESMDNDSIVVISKLYKDALYAINYYSDIILLEPKTVFGDGVRYQSQDDAHVLHKYIEMFMEQHNVPHIRCDYTKDTEELIMQIFDINTVEEVPPQQAYMEHI